MREGSLQALTDRSRAGLHRFQSWLQRQSSDPEGQVLLALGTVGVLTAGWVLFWPVPTEVVGRGVMIVPGGSRVIDARAEGQILSIAVKVGQTVSKGQPLITMYLPTLDQELRRQEHDLLQLIGINANLNQRDGVRLESARRVRDTSLAKLQSERLRLGRLRRTYNQKVADFRLLSRRDVVAPLSEEVVATEDRATQLDVAIENLRIREKEVVDAYEKVKLEIDTEQQRRQYRIDDTRRQIKVTKARLGYEGTLLADRPGQILDLQVVRGQTVKPGQRLGTLGGKPGDTLFAVAYFPPADARRLPIGLPMEVVPDWHERGRFGGLLGQVQRVSLLPATREDVDTTMGNPQLADALVKGGPVMRADIALARGSRSFDGYRWTLSRGSSVFPIREGLTLKAHGYVEWRTPISYVVPGLRELTGSYRNLAEEGQDRPQTRQRGTLP
ncbi:MAG: NHLP bacteriocin system secretion protein [Cyanobium sp. LacPavin_0920_WC12_MAG_62_9]|nr:NHLP bacteriocin system secretion protein [Cyanobium sp. LacPavin_0920_WC12_MAG_62_9]